MFVSVFFCNFATQNFNTMALFQLNVLQKHLSSLDKGLITDAYKRYQSYFLNPEVQSNIRSSKEEQFQEGFLSELFVKVLGYTLNPSPNYNLITEKKNETNAKKADGAILVDNRVVAVIELKDGKTSDLSKVEQQAFGYKSQNKGATYVIISNFEKLRFYIDNAVEYEEFDLFHLTYEEFEVLYLLLSYPQIEKNIPKIIKSESLSKEDEITKALYKDYSNFKRVLFADILEHNQVNTNEEKILLFKKTQKLLDRLLFIFFAEDSLLLPPNTMIRIISDWEKLNELDEYKPLYERIKKYFTWLNNGHKGKDFEIFAYNGGLFKPDEILDNLVITDDILLQYTRKLSAYNYVSEVDVNILGHIFENSLTEIEEITNQLQKGTEPTISKRKRDGVFYTPQYITKYIVDNTIGKLCGQKKNEIGIKEEEYFCDKKRHTGTIKALVEKLECYREWLQHVTICDPACGSGAFLSAALQFLKAEHQLINDMQAKVTGGGISFAYFDNDILENNLYGVDVNEESVEIAKLSLWLRTAQPNRKLSSLNNNIKCGNSLISDPSIVGDKAFCWEQEFPEVFAKGGFDVIVGNPPYVVLPPSQLQGYNYIKGNNNTYVAFVEQILRITNDKKNVGLIIPTTWYAGDNYLDFRNYLLEMNLIQQIIQLPYDIFEAYIDTTILILNAEHNGREVSVYKYDVNNKTHEINVDSFESIDSSIWMKYGKVFLNKQLLCIFEKVWNSDINTKLGTIASINRGCLPPKEHELSKITDSYFNIPWFSSQVFRYRTDIQDKTYVSYENLRENKPMELYNSVPKIMARQLLSRQFRINMTLTTEPTAFKKNIYAIYNVDSKIDIRYLLAYLNSKLFSYCEVNFNSALQRDDFPAFSLNDFKEFPIPVIPVAEQSCFINFVDLMLAQNENLQSKRNRFCRRLKDNFEDVKITGALETFDLLEFKEFIRELGKQKIKLSLVQQDEWEEYFDMYKSECNAISEQISTTDEQIDRLVYQLYNLTEEEISIIESN